MTTLLDILAEVNTTVNSAVPYVTDIENYGLYEYWNNCAGPKGEDCDGFALIKLRALLNKGVDISLLRLAVCWCETGDYHCVLLVDVGDDRATYVLDNRYPYPMEYSMLPYRWDKIQIAGTRDWEGVNQ